MTFETSGYLPWLDFGVFGIQTYFVVISLTLSALAFFIVKRAISQEVPQRQALDLYIVAMLSGFVGSRFFHIIWEEPNFYLESPLRAFDLLSGGFVWYGGFLGGLLGLYAFHKMRKSAEKLALRVWLDFFAPIAALGYGLGRIACVLTGCCYGGVCHLHGAVFRFPTQGLAVAYELVVAGLLIRIEQRIRPGKRKPGQLFFFWLVLHGMGRLVMEFFRADPRGYQPFGLSIASLLSLTLILVGLYKLRTVKWSGILSNSSKSS